MASNGDTVPGLGFKDKDKALETIKNLEGRDADYQKLAVKGLIGRAKRTLQVTKAEDKLTNIKEAVETFERWLKDFEKKRQVNWSYLPLATVEAFLGLWCDLTRNEDRDKETTTELTNFLKAYRAADGDYKKLRTVASGENEPTWDIIRNRRLKDLIQKIDDTDPDMWDNEELPTVQHVELIMWAYSPDASKIKKRLPTLETKLKEYKVDSENSKDKKSSKRKSEGKKDRESSDDEEPEKKKKGDD